MSRQSNLEPLVREWVHYVEDKEASGRAGYQVRKESSSPAAEHLIPGLTAGVPIYGPLQTLGSVVGRPTGLLRGPVSDEEKTKITDRSGTDAFIPGVGGWRLGRRERGVAGESVEDGATRLSATGQVIGEQGGPALQMILGAIGGGLLADEEGAMAGAITPLVLNAAGLIASTMTKRRSREEQTKVDSPSILRKLRTYLLPGQAGYDMGKRWGRSRDWEGTPEPEKDKDED